MKKYSFWKQTHNKTYFWMIYVILELLVNRDLIQIFSEYERTSNISYLLGTLFANLLIPYILLILIFFCIFIYRRLRKEPY